MFCTNGVSNLPNNLALLREKELPERRHFLPESSGVICEKAHAEQYRSMTLALVAYAALVVGRAQACAQEKKTEPRASGCP